MKCESGFCIPGLYCIRCYVESRTRSFLWGLGIGVALASLVTWVMS